MTLDVRTVDLARLNSLTKYPSIPTYHALDPRNGALLEETQRFDGPVLLTEKIDGTNARMIVLPGGFYLLGSRSELLYGQGDLVGNPAMGIVDALRPVADALSVEVPGDAVRVYFGEVYGGKVTGASKQYTGSRQVGFRLFDVAEIDDVADRLAETPDAIARWRDEGGQRFLDERALQAAADSLAVPLTPRLGEVASLPTGIAEAEAFLKEVLPETRSALDDGAGAQPEGIVARSLDRAAIAKLRFADYRRAAKRRR